MLNEFFPLDLILGSLQHDYDSVTYIDAKESNWRLL